MRTILRSTLRAAAIGSPTFRTVSLRIYPDGQVELMQRTSAKFATTFDPQRFPFDRQKLAAEVVVRGDDGLSAG